MPETADIIQTIRTHQPTVQAIYLFGSAVNNTARPDSDLDIAVVMPHGTSDIDWWAWGFDLTQEFGVEIDLIDLRQVSTVFQFEIIRTGQRIYCSDQVQCDFFEAIILSLYQKLNLERAEILSAFWQTGRAYDV